MIDILQQELKKYDWEKIKDVKYPFAEIIQKIILVSLSKTDFFNKAIFCGGTALRIVYHLDRFSKDLDFSLKEEDKNFNFLNYLNKISDILQSFGLNFQSSSDKNKTNVHKIIFSFNLFELCRKYYPKNIENKINQNQNWNWCSSTKEI